MERTPTREATSAKPLRVRVFDQVREMVLDGRLKAGMALPPSRLMAERPGLSRDTVTTASERRAAEGSVKVGDGMLVLGDSSLAEAQIESAVRAPTSRSQAARSIVSAPH